ncbi:helix-turn-helix transcriptional regulator [Nocardioides sp. 31GB23]|uniref:helix-turn-helix transcriptional regulator n=1 Tax=Nocardioides sp. 31GB23 TaxID=3156065 RepID=UPI0032AF914C
MKDDKLAVDGDWLLEHGSAKYLASRIKELRTQRGWTQPQLVRALAEHGCHVPQSAISRLEASATAGGRSITVDEALGFARTFGLALEDLLLPPGFAERYQWFVDVAEGGKLRAEFEAAAERYFGVVDRQAAAGRLDEEWALRLRSLAEARRVEGVAPDANWDAGSDLAFLEDVLAKMDQAQ